MILIHHKTNDTAFTGLEAAIVLIAFVVVAAVFSYVVLGAGFYTTQKAQEAVYTAVAQGTSNIQMIGQVYGLTADASATQINQIRFSVGLAPGAPAVDLSKMTIVFSTPSSTAPVTYQAQAVGTCILATNTFCAKLDNTDINVASLSPQQQVQISFLVSPTVPKNTPMNFEIRPPVGAALPFIKTSPPAITPVNVLY